jgi:DNA-binding beta-propeller fold protein YncE
VPRIPVLFLATAAVALPPSVGRADIIVSSNDAHAVMDAQKHMVAPDRPGPDTVTVIDVTTYPPRIKATFDAPGSVVGPPGAIWISKDESWGIVTAATQADPSASSGISPDDRVSVFDLSGSVPAVVQTLTAGFGATQVSVSPDGALALVANRAEGSVSVFTIKDKRLIPAGKINTGDNKSLPSAVLFVDDHTALLSRGGDNMVSILHIDGTNVTIDPRPLTTGVAPYSMDINGARTLAAVSNMGRGDARTDSVSLIDLTAKPFRTVGTFSVPSGPEPLKFSPDGRYLAIGAENGTTKPASDPLHADHGLLGIYAADGHTLRKLAETPTGGWIEGVAFSRDGKTVMLQGMQDRVIEVFRWDGHHLTSGPSLRIDGAGPASFATPWP